MAIFEAFLRGSAMEAIKIATYDTDLTNDHWHLLRRFLPAAKKRGRPRTALREVLNAILYRVKTGAQWRRLPKNFPPGQTVYPHFRQLPRTQRCLHPAGQRFGHPSRTAQAVGGRRLQWPRVRRPGADATPQTYGGSRRTARRGARFPRVTQSWVIERTFGWLMHCCRLVRDDE